MKTQLKHLLTMALVALAAWSTARGGSFDAAYRDLPFAMPEVQRPSIPDFTILLPDQGGVADGRTINTEAFARAMQTLKEHGGGRLVVPAGIWLTGPIELESHVELHLERGALILFTDDRTQYPLIDGNFEGLNTKRCQSPLSAHDKQDIAVTGPGAINGNGQAWRPVKRGKLTAGQWKELTEGGGATNAKGDVWYVSDRVREVSENPDAMRRAYNSGTSEAWDYVHDFLRPVMVSLVNCKNVLLEDATFENSPAWNLHPLGCENVIIHNVTVRNPWYAQNGDGLDLESCRNVLVIDSSFDVGDDAICIKSGKDKQGRDRGMPCENVVVEGCVVYHGHGGFVIGSEMSGGARNIMVRNCLFSGTDVGLRFKSTRGRGGVVEKIWCDRIYMNNIAGDAIIFDLYYGIKPGAPVPPVSEKTPEFRDFHITNIVCQQSKCPLRMTGLPELPVSEIHFADCLLHGRTAAQLDHVRNTTLDRVRIEVEEAGEPIRTGNVQGLAVTPQP